jgi:hypothetical protein
MAIVFFENIDIAGDIRPAGRGLQLLQRHDSWYQAGSENTVSRQQLPWCHLLQCKVMDADSQTLLRLFLCSLRTMEPSNHAL